MATKLEKNTFPSGHAASDFKCFGPPATQDGEFENVKIADMGCFTQDGKDSNKYYHAAVVQSTKDGIYYAYFEWARTGAKSPSFQFVACSSEAEAQREFVAQCREKNDKRGQWTTIAGIRTLQAKPGKDCYLVRPQAARSTGLPDAKTIKLNEGAKQQSKPVPSAAAPSRQVDDYTLRLMRDLSVATVSYTRGAMADSSLPTQKAIDEARTLLTEAQKRVLRVGDDVALQAQDRDLVQITNMMYSRIPKKKALNAAVADWMLTGNNILGWQADLDAFESALYSTDAGNTVNDPFGGMPLDMQWVDPKSPTGKFLYFWWPKASANRHGYLKNMQIKNIWAVDRHGDQARLEKAQDEIIRGQPRIRERPLFQPGERPDLDATLAKRYQDTNTALLFHGTRSVNVSGILRESFRLPKELVGVVITGSLYGPLIYMADDWRKSAGYTSLGSGLYSAGGGGVRGRDAFMFACDVACGNPYVASGPKGYTAAPAGHHCIFGKGGVSGVQNNEWVIPKKDQARIRYLAEFSA